MSSQSRMDFQLILVTVAFEFISLPSVQTMKILTFCSNDLINTMAYHGSKFIIFSYYYYFFFFVSFQSFSGIMIEFVTSFSIHTC